MMEPIKIIIEVVVRTDGNVIARVYPEEAGSVPIGVQVVPTPPIPTETKTIFRCNQWRYNSVDKNAESCDGCKVACPVKGRYKGEEMTI